MLGSLDIVRILCDGLKWPSGWDNLFIVTGMVAGNFFILVLFLYH